MQRSSPLFSDWRTDRQLSLSVASILRYNHFLCFRKHEVQQRTNCPSQFYGFDKTVMSAVLLDMRQIFVFHHRLSAMAHGQIWRHKAIKWQKIVSPRWIQSRFSATNNCRRWVYSERTKHIDHLTNLVTFLEVLKVKIRKYGTVSWRISPKVIQKNILVLNIRKINDDLLWLHVKRRFA